MASGSGRLLLCIGVLVSWAHSQTAANRLEFEVASVKPADPGSRAANVVPGSGESLTIQNVPLEKIILYAYDIRPFQLADVPGWVSTERYDIMAKTAATDLTVSESATETDQQRRDRVARVRERLRSLLSDRFGLRVHVEQKEQTILSLRIAKGGPKLAEAAANAGSVSTRDGRIQGFGAPVSMLATQLSIATELSVADETGLQGRYDFVLEWAPDEKDPNDTRSSIYSAVVEQLGLRLERAKAQVNTVVIDRIERPTAN